MQLLISFVKACMKTVTALADWKKQFHVSQKPFLKCCNKNPGISLFGRTNPKMTNMLQNAFHGHCKSVMRTKDISVAQVDLWD